MVQNDCKHEDDLHPKLNTGKTKWQTLIFFWTGLCGADIRLVLYSIDNNTVWNHQVTYCQL